MTRILIAAAFAAGALFALPAGAATPEPHAASILQAVRQATLARPLASISTIHVQGTTEIFGIRAASAEYDDLPGMSFTSTLKGGAITSASGWNGRNAWSQDYSGLTHVDGGQSGRLQAIDQAYFDTFAYLRADAGGARVTYAGKKSIGGTSYDVLAVTPPHGTQMDLWIDPATHLIARQTATIGIVSVTATYSDYRMVDGLAYPFVTVTQSSQGNSSKTVLSSVTLNENIAAHMTMPRTAVRDFSVAGGKTTVPLQVINNHLYVRAKVNGRGPYTFILDSGGDYIITPEVARALKTKRAGGLQIGGVGNTTEGAGFTHVDSISVGGALVRNQYMLVLPIGPGFGLAEGVHIDGMIGYQWLARFVTTIDYAGGRITFAMPTAASPLHQPGSIAFFIDGSIPRIPIAIDGVTTSGEVDTGSRAALTISAPFAAAHPEIAALARTAPGVDGFGVGGPSFARLGRVHTLQIGSFALRNAIAAFGVQRKGAFADPYNPANLGGAIWRHFTVTFDYGHQVMTLRKNAEFGKPFSYDRSGMFLIDKGGAYTIISAMAATPAAAAGLQSGDVIAGVNGVAASNYTLAQLRALLSAPAGTVVHLHLRGAKGERDVTLTLADYV